MAGVDGGRTQAVVAVVLVATVPGGIGRAVVAPAVGAAGRFRRVTAASARTSVLPVVGAFDVLAADELAGLAAVVVLEVGGVDGDDVSDVQAERVDVALVGGLQLIPAGIHHGDVVLDEGPEGLAGDATPEEWVMFDSLPAAFSLLDSLNSADQERVRGVVTTLTQGMEMDLTTFPAGDAGELAPLSTASDLDRYTYLVAGCVGEFWTTTMAAHQRELAGWDAGKMSEAGIRFGKALQLTNVLRDVPRDLRNGRCYLPADGLAAVGLSPEDLKDPQNAGRAKPVFEEWVRTALGHFYAAEEYLTAIPRRSVRLRLACLWPLLLGLATLAKVARSGRWLEPDSTLKVSRRWVYWMMLISPLKIRSNSLVRHWTGIHRRQVERTLGAPSSD